VELGIDGVWVDWNRVDDTAALRAILDEKVKQKGSERWAQVVQKVIDAATSSRGRPVRFEIARD